MKSIIVTDEMVENKERRFGSIGYYYPAKVKINENKTVNALFTKNQLEVAMKRAERNPEDIKDDRSFWDWLLGD